MKTLALLATGIVAASIALPAMAQTSVTLAETAPVLTLNVTESIESAPDVAMVSAGVQTRAPTAREALALNSTQMTQVIARIERAGVAKKDIQTSGINLNPQYDYNTRNADGSQGVPRFVGYEVSNQVNVKIRDIAGLGGLLDALVAAGATNINGPSFSIDKPDALLVQARTKALQSAQAQAEFYARQTGYRSVRLVALSENLNGGGMPMPVLQRFKAADAVAASAPVAPGEVSTGVTLTVQYALVK